MLRYAKRMRCILHKNPSLLRIPTNELLCSVGSSQLFLQARQHTLTRANMPARRQEAVLWVTADPTRIFVYTSPQDPNTASTLGGIVLALFIHGLQSQSNRLFIIFILVGAFCPGEQGAYLTKWKNCRMSAHIIMETKSARGLRDLEGEKSLQSHIWLVRLQLPHLQFSSWLPLCLLNTLVVLI